MFGKLLRGLSSLKVTVLLLGLFALLGGTSMALRWDFFHSPYFYGLALLFSLNLGACTAKRLLGQLRKKGNKRHGPDILHVGLLVLIAASVYSTAAHRESSFWMTPGDAVALPDGGTLTLADFQHRSYPDGRPEAFVATVRILPPGGGRARDATIEVNHPLRLSGCTLYQQSYATRPSVLLAGPKGRLVRIFGGDGGTLEGLGTLRFIGDQGEGADRVGLFELKGPSGTTEELRLTQGGTLGPWAIQAYADLEATGLLASSDPAWPFILVGFALLGLGLCLTYAQKLKELDP